MTDTRMVRLEQIWPGKFRPNAKSVLHGAAYVSCAMATGEADHVTPSPIKVHQKADAAGGDTYEAATRRCAWVVEVMRRAKWPHLVKVEVVT